MVAAVSDAVVAEVESHPSCSPHVLCFAVFITPLPVQCLLAAISNPAVFAGSLESASMQQIVQDELAEITHCRRICLADAQG